MLIDIVNYPYAGASNPETPSLSQAVPGLIEGSAYHAGGDVDASKYSIVKLIGRWENVHPKKAPPELDGFVRDGVRNDYEVGMAVEMLATKIADQQWDRGARTLTLGGDHSQGFATIKATLLVEVTRAILEDGRIPVTTERNEEIKARLRAYANKGKWRELASYVDNLAYNKVINIDDIQKVTDGINIIWIDAHGDFNSADTSGTANFHGMSLAAACGEYAAHIEGIFGDCIKANPKNIYVVGARDLDPAERQLMLDRGVNFTKYTMDGRDGINICATTAPTAEGKPLHLVLKEILAEKPGGKFIMSVDMDHINGDEVPGVNTPMGLSVQTIRERSLEASQSSHPESYIRRNSDGISARGIPFEDSLYALWGIMRHPQVIAGDLTEGGVDFVDNPKSANNFPTLKLTSELLMGMVQQEPYHVVREDLAFWHNLQDMYNELQYRASSYVKGCTVFGPALPANLRSAYSNPALIQ